MSSGYVSTSEVWNVFWWGYGAGETDFFKIQDKGFFALGIPAAAAVDTHISGYVIHNL